MKTILYVYSTYSRAKQEFKRFIEKNDPNGVAFSYCYSNLTAEGNGILLKFTFTDMRIRGLSIDSVFVDEGEENKWLGVE